MADLFYVYILANVRSRRPVLYTGVTNDMRRRIVEHLIERANPTWRDLAGEYSPLRS